MSFVTKAVAGEGERWLREVNSHRAPEAELGRLQLDAQRAFVLTCATEAAALCGPVRSGQVWHPPSHPLPIVPGYWAALSCDHREGDRMRFRYCVRSFHCASVRAVEQIQDPLPPGSGLIVRQMNADPWLVAEFLRGPGAAISYLLIGCFWSPSSVYLVLNMMSHDCALCDIAHQCDARGVQSRSAKIV